MMTSKSSWSTPGLNSAALDRALETPASAAGRAAVNSAVGEKACCRAGSGIPAISLVRDSRLWVVCPLLLTSDIVAIEHLTILHVKWAARSWRGHGQGGTEGIPPRSGSSHGGSG